MAKVKQKDLLDAGVHFGHMTSKWDPRMAPYIFMEKNGVHIIDLNQTKRSLESAGEAAKNIVKSGRKIMFVATKKQAKEVVVDEAKKLNMPYVTERWLGGMMTNFATVRKSLKKLSSIDKLMKGDEFNALAKRERLMRTRDKEKLQRVLGGIQDMTRLPAALFVVDAKREHIAIAEAKKLNIPVFAIVDTNTNPNSVDFPIPGNDDAFKSIEILTKAFSASIEEGLAERKKDKDNAKQKEMEAEKKAVDASKEENTAKEEKAVDSAKKEVVVETETATEEKK